MSAANNPISHHTSHTMGNGASSSDSGARRGQGTHPVGHHTSHTMGNGASSSSGGGIPGAAMGPMDNAETQRDDFQTSLMSLLINDPDLNPTIDPSTVLGKSDIDTATEHSSHGSIADDNCESLIDEPQSDATSLYCTSNLANFSIIDSTLREGEQFSTAYFDTAQKLKIAQALDNFGVEYIEVTSPVASEQSRADCEAICKLGLKAKVLCHIRCNLDDARVAVQTGVDGVNICIGTSSQLMKHSHGHDMAYIEAKAREVVEYVKSNNIEVRFSGEDTFRSDFSEVLKLYSLVDRLGVHRVGIADTVGGASPMEVYAKIYTLRQILDCDLETHFHNDTGCAIANAYTALEAGATHIDTTILGIGERNGITSLGGLMASLMPTNREYILGKYKIKKLHELEALVADIVGVEIPFNNFVL